MVQILSPFHVADGAVPPYNIVVLREPPPYFPSLSNADNQRHFRPLNGGP